MRRWAPSPHLLRRTSDPVTVTVGLRHVLTGVRKRALLPPLLRGSAASASPDPSQTWTPAFLAAPPSWPSRRTARILSYAQFSARGACNPMHRYGGGTGDRASIVATSSLGVVASWCHSVHDPSYIATLS